MRDPILITGCARSGTSLTAGIIELSGAFGGLTTPPRAHNRKGQFENDTIRNTVIKAYLLRAGFDPMGQNPLPDINNLLEFPNIKECMEKIMKKQGYKENMPWYYKGAKLCLIWPIIHKAFPNAKWVIVRRNNKDIINSCLKTHFMRAYKDTKGWQKWIDEHKRRFYEMEVNNLNMKYIWPSNFVNGNLTEIQEVINWLGLKYNQNIIKEFIDPKLWDTSKKEN